MIKIINYFFQSLFIYVFFFIGLILRLKLGRVFFSYIFSLIGPTIKPKQIIEKNLDIFSSYKGSIDKNLISSSMWKNYGKTFIEYVFLYKFQKNNSHIKIKGEKNLEKVLQNKKPVIFVSGHFANFELMSMEITKKQIKLATIYRPLNNIFLNPLMEYLRKKYVCNYQIKKGIKGVREAISYLKKNYSIALMIDQRVSEGEKINFFGKTALTTTLPAQLAFKFNLEIVPVFIERTLKDNFVLEFQKSINVKNFKNKIELSQELNHILEKMIIKNPNQWIWTHNRWK